MMTNKTCLLTGGSRGIGHATADLLRARGWDVIAPTRAELDFSNIYAGEVWSAKNRFKHIDAVAFCNGVWLSKQIANQLPSMFVEQFISRVVAPVDLMQYLILRDAPPKCVVTVSSTRGFIGGVETGPYALACAAQIAMMQGYAREYAGVRFNCVCPGLTDTDMGQDVIKTGGAKPGAAMQPPGVVAAEIVRLIESDDNGRVMRVVNSEVSEAKWSW